MSGRSVTSTHSRPSGTRPYARQPSLRDRIRPLALKRLAPALIAGELGVSSDSVRGILSRMRRSGEELPLYAPPPPSLRVVISQRDLARLEAEAARRGTDARGLAEAIVRIIVRDGIFAALLDDDDETGGAAGVR